MTRASCKRAHRTVDKEQASLAHRKTHVSILRKTLFEFKDDRGSRGENVKSKLYFLRDRRELDRHSLVEGKLLDVLTSGAQALWALASLASFQPRACLAK